MYDRYRLSRPQRGPVFAALLTLATLALLVLFAA